MSRNKVVLGVLGVIAVAGAAGYSAFQVGLNQGQEQGELQAKKAFEESNQIIVPKFATDDGMRRLEAKMTALKSKLAQLDETSKAAQEGLSEVSQIDTSELEAAKLKVEALPRSPDQKAVPLPEGSASAKVLNQPKTASGIPESVVRNYQKETGVNPAEIEAIMRKTQ